MSGAAQQGGAPRARGPSSDSGAVEHVLRRLERLVGCDLSASSRLARLGGHWVHDGVVVRGGGSARERWASADGQASVVPWDPERPAWEDVGRFRSTFDSSKSDPEALQRIPVYARFYLPVGLTSDARMLVYDGDRFVCWIGLLRADRERPFGANALRRLNAAASSIAADLVALDRRRLAEERGAPADLVFGAAGALIAACPAGRTWIDEGRADELAAIVRSADRHDLKHAIVGGRLVHVTRMDGPGGVRYLLNVRAPHRPRVSAAGRLTERQREVAGFAARGATIDEIARHLSVGRETVREHLKRAYAALGVASRLELARALSSLET